MLPVVVSTVHALPSLQLAGHVPGGSQVSPGSMTPLPQLAEQSESVFALQPAGQQPSPAAHAVMPSLQLAGHDEGGSQVSPGSITPLPHDGTLGQPAPSGGRLVLQFAVQLTPNEPVLG